MKNAQRLMTIPETPHEIQRTKSTDSTVQVVLPEKTIQPDSQNRLSPAIRLPARAHRLPGAIYTRQAD